MLEGVTGREELQRKRQGEHQRTYWYSGALMQYSAEEIVHIVIQAHRVPRATSES